MDQQQLRDRDDEFLRTSIPAGTMMNGTDRDELEKDIRSIIKGDVRRDEPMDRHTSFGVGGRADFFLAPESCDELVRLVDFLERGAVPYFPVGNCTNLVVRDGGYRGVLISLRSLQGMKRTTSAAGEALLRCEAGLSLARLVDVALRESLAGLEFLAGIPGSLGGALRMNAGAWGSEMKDVVYSLSCIVPGRGMNTIPRSRLSFHYRSLALPERSIIAAADIAVAPGEAEDIERRIEENSAQRRQRHPLEYRSAGSVFKNPSGIPAGRIIDELGLKGMSVDDAMVSERHGNFIINRGQARAAHILALIDRVKRTVKEQRGIELETEVVVIGEEP